MDPVTGLVLSKAIQGVTDVVGDVLSPSDTPSGSNFDAVLRASLQPNQANEINEEELFAALIEERITALKGQELGAEYKSALEAQKNSIRRGDGYINVEQAAENALAGLAAAGKLTAEEASTIRGQAFQAAQLDDNHEALYDSRGSGSDPTIATMDMEAALAQARAMIEKLTIGDEPAAATEEEDDTQTDEENEETTVNDSAIIPSGTSFDGDGEGFLFKPVSDSGELVILLPSDLANEVLDVVLKNKEGEEVERGNSSGYANPDSGGEREHFRFAKAGGDYPQDLTVEVRLKDGSTKQFIIPDPSLRYD